MPLRPRHLWSAGGFVTDPDADFRMARHPTAGRVHRTATTPDDAFIARVLEISAWAKTHSRALTIGIVALVAVVLVAAYVRNFQATARAAAESRFLAVQQTVASGNTALAIRDLEEFLATHGSSEVAKEARILLAQSYLIEGDPEKAIAAVDPVAKSIGEGLGTTAALLKAAALESAGRVDEAEALYLRIADRARFDYERVEALDAAARIRMDRGDAAGATQLYDRLLALSRDGSADAAVFEMRRAEARARAQN